MRSAWICVLSLVCSACASSAPVSDVDDTALGLGSGDDAGVAGDSPPLAAKPVVTCFDARNGISVAVEARRPGGPAGPGQPPPPRGDGEESCDPGAPPHGEGLPVPGRPAPNAPQPPVLVVVERESGAVACGCGFGFAESVRGVAGVPADAPVPGIPPTPPVPVAGAASGTSASGGHHVSGGMHTVSGPAVPVAGGAHTAASGGPDAPGVPGVPGAPVITVTVSSGAPGEPAKIVPPPSCDVLTEQCYADGFDTELCEQLAACCENTSAPN
jgi:hypothetical protein